MKTCTARGICLNGDVYLYPIEWQRAAILTDEEVLELLKIVVNRYRSGAYL